MFDLICIFTKGGVVVWSKFFCSAGLDLVNILIKNVLMEEKTAQAQFIYQNYIFKWRLENQSGLIFAVIYQEVLQLTFVDEFIEMLRDDYMEKCYPKITIKNGFLETLPDYDNSALQKWQQKAENVKKETMRTFENTKRGQKVVDDQKKRESDDKKAAAKKKKEEEKRKLEEEENRKREEARRLEAEKKAEEEKLKTDEEILEKQKLESRQMLAERKGKGKSPKKDAPKIEEKSPKDPKKNTKEARGWGYTDKVSKKDMAALDHSKKIDKALNAPLVDKKEDYFGNEEEMKKINQMENDDGLDFGDDSDEEIKEKSPTEELSRKSKDSAPKKTGLFARLTSGIKNLTGNKTMEEADLIPVLQDFRKNLVQKNVATEIADKICESVKASLLTQKTATFTSVKSTVKEALKTAIQRVLTPKVNIDILKEAQSAKARGVPYTIVFIGVNGVGKSTSLAKTAYYLKTKGGLNVMIAACDNFRAGAIEQLETHGHRLDIPVFQRGYGNDAAEICKEAIHEAKTKKFDVVLIDTAGRMQDNEPLMKALAKLINVNNPNVILFVGEALVGNDAIDQLTKFNKSLVDFGSAQNPRLIDGIILTKFDTVDEKVGAALSMVYTTGKPIVFVGVGQKYPHLAKLNVNTVVHVLMS